MAEVPAPEKEPCPWARLVLLLVRFRPLVEGPRAGRIFDSTLGYPGEMPRRQHLPLDRRPAVDLLDGVGRNPEVQGRRATALLHLRGWLEADGLDWAEFLELPPAAVSRRLAAFGQALYDGGRPLGCSRRRSTRSWTPGQTLEGTW